MPYVTEEERRKIAPERHPVKDALPRTIVVEEAVANVGNLNYAVSMLMHSYLFMYGRRYAHINLLMGVLRKVEHELLIERGCIPGGRPTTLDVGLAIKDRSQFFWATKALCLDYVIRHGTSDEEYDNVLGVLDCAGKEFYRRVAAPYEDTKIEENGDIV